MEQPFFDQFLPVSSPEVDVEAIRREWLALQPPFQIAERGLPLPVWARRGLSDNGEHAWATLCRDAGQLDPARPMCIYVHIPFCARKCDFCDCYSYRLVHHQAGT